MTWQECLPTAGYPHTLEIKARTRNNQFNYQQSTAKSYSRSTLTNCPHVLACCATPLKLKGNTPHIRWLTIVHSSLSLTVSPTASAPPMLLWNASVPALSNYIQMKWLVMTFSWFAKPYSLTGISETGKLLDPKLAAEWWRNPDGARA